MITFHKPLSYHAIYAAKFVVEKDRQLRDISINKFNNICKLLNEVLSINPTLISLQNISSIIVKDFQHSMILRLCVSKNVTCQVKLALILALLRIPKKNVKEEILEILQGFQSTTPYHTSELSTDKIDKHVCRIRYKKKTLYSSEI